MVGRSFLCRIILVGIVLKLWLSVIFSMIYLSIKYFYEKVYIIIHNFGVVYGLFHGTGGCCESLHLQF